MGVRYHTQTNSPRLAVEFCIGIGILNPAIVYFSKSSFLGIEIALDRATCR